MPRDVAHLDMNQLSFPSEVTVQEVLREQTLGGAIDLCAKAAGLVPKQVQEAIKADKAQFSRWTDGKEGIVWPKLVALMDACGNDAPLLWMLHQRGFDLASVRKRETEVERQNRVLREENAALRRVLQGVPT
jgi:plasmid maintenance system antidote protein VapI